MQFFVENLRKEARNRLGMAIQEPKKYANAPLNQPGIVGGVFARAKKECGSGLQMIMFIIPDGHPVYNDIKLVGDTQDGIVTQCLKASNCTRPKGGLYGNLLLKINAKLGGINRILLPLPNSNVDKPRILSDFGKFPVMILGADITHPSPGDKLSSSVAACVGSYDKDQFFYASSISVQEHHRFTSREVDAVETIQKLDEMLKELFNAYRNKNNRFPQHVVYYRDGISEGEFRSVLDYELRKLYEAARAVGFNKKPRVTFIVVQKRHHTRFRPRDRNDGDRKGNIKAGTVVDTRVVHPTDNDFYLCSHNGIQGTSRPTHYFVLHDDHDFSSDELQKLSYYLCYTYSRCATPISIPTPVMYAHLAAYRARNHIVAANVSATPPPLGLESQEQRLAREQQLAAELNRSVQVNEVLKSRLYYC